jgi:hypothetical protein
MITRTEAHRIMREREITAAKRAAAMDPAQVGMDGIFGIRAHEITPITRKADLTQRQISVLGMVAERHGISPGCGILVDSWLVRVMDALVRRGMLTKTERVRGVVYGGYAGAEYFRAIPTWTLTAAGYEALSTNDRTRKV